MNKLYLLMVRIITGGLIAVIILKIFRPDARPVHAAGFAALLVGFAYAIEYIRKRNSNN